MKDVKEYLEAMPDISEHEIDNLLTQAAQCLKPISAVCDGGSFNLHAYKTRVKEKLSILEKIYRKRNGLNDEEVKKDYGLHSLGDIIGLRFITLFAEEQIAIVETLLESTFGKGSHQLYGIRTGSLKEVKIYTNRVKEHDEVGLKIKRIVEDKLKEEDLDIPVMHDTSKKSYSSIHFSFVTDKSVPIELQLRTSLEDTYGEVDHLVKYKKHSSGNEGKSYLEDHLDVLKQSIDTSISHSNLIYKIFNRQPTFNNTVNNVPPLFDKVGELLKTAGFHSDFIKKYEELTHTFSTLKKEKGGGGNFSGLADAYRELLSKFYSEEHELYDKALYFCEMGAADALLDSRDSNCINNAKKSYTNLLKEHAENPLIYYRIGRALEQDNLYPEAIENYQRAHELSCSIKERQSYCQEFVTKDQVEIVNLHSPKLIGYCYWAIFDRNKESDHDISLIDKALDSTEQGLTVNRKKGKDDEIHSCLNNLVFFWALKSGEQELSDDELSDAGNHYKEFEKSVKLRNSNDERDWETLAFAGLALGFPDECVLEACDKVDEIIKGSIGSDYELTKLEIRLLKSVHSIRSKLDKIETGDL